MDARVTLVVIEGLERMIPEDLLAPFSQEAIDAILADVMDAARDWWIAEAKADLHMTRGDYIDGIQPVEMSPGQGAIALVGELPNIVENGQDQVDMRTTLLGPNVPISPPGERGKHLSIDPRTFETGYYRAIPFRHSGAGSQGTTGKPMPKDVYKAAKDLRRRISDPYKGSSWAGGEEEEAKPKRLGEEFGSRYAGMVKYSKAYKAYENTPGGPKGPGVQSTYMTFRTISTKQTEGWIRPSSPGKHFMERALEYAERTMIDAVKAFCEG